MKHLISSFLFKSFVFLTLTMKAGADDSLRIVSDMQIIRERMLLPFLESPDMVRVNEYLQGLYPDGSWVDIDYADTSTTAWKPVEHLRRLEVLTHAWFTPASHLYHNPELRRQIGMGLDYWLRRDPRRPWWWNSIGAPRIMGWILLMLDENLTVYQRTQGIKVLEKAILGSTGQNLVWQAEITARRALLQKDDSLLMKAFDLIASEIKISDKEGIQPDFSFHQHGQCLYNHGYGAGFAEDNAKLAALTAGTVFEYKPDKINLLSSLILDGSQWLARGPVSDYAAEGRELTRPGENAGYLGDAAEYMLALRTGREKEFSELLARIRGEKTVTLIGNKHFYRSDIMVHHRPGWYMSAKMYSVRIFNTDGLSGCDEGLLSHYLAEGATTIMRHGNEYRNIFPVWDWQHIPGTTVELKPHIPGEPKRKGTTIFAGGTSDGTYGVAGFQLMRDSLSARKAWFFFSDMAVCLGSAIRCNTEYPVVTTLNQCLSKSPVVIGLKKSSGTINEGERKFTARWILHDSITYLFDKAIVANISNKEQTGSWKRISAQKSANSIEEKVFMLSLDHGANPANASYAYAVIPGTEEKDITAYLTKPSYRIISNNSNIQAVFHRDDKMIGIVFHEQGLIKWKKWLIETDQPCILLIRKNKRGWKLAVSDPTAKQGIIRLKLKLPDRKSEELQISLPEGLYAGSSQIINLD